MIWFRDYFIPWLFTIILHFVVVVLAGWGWQSPAEEVNRKIPAYVKAKLVKLDEIKVKSPAVTKKAKKKKAQEKKRKKEVEQKRLKAQKLAKQQAKEKKRAVDLKKKKAEQAKVEKNHLAEAARLKELEQASKKEAAQQLLAQALEDEDEFMVAQSDQELVQSYSSMIDSAVRKNWSRPPSARNNMVVVLRIHLIPTGRVVNVDVIESSGNDAFDRSAVVAITKTQQFPELMNLSSRVFEANFRQFKLKFKPEDLRR